MSERAQEHRRTKAAQTRRLVVLLLSLSVHIGGIVLLGLYEPPPERVEPPHIYAEVTVLDAVPTPARPQPVDPPEEPDEPVPPEEAEERNAPVPAKPAPTSEAEPRAPTAPDEQPGEPGASAGASEPSAGPSKAPSIALRNLRDSSQRSTSGVVVPRPDRAALVDGGSMGSHAGANAAQSGYGPGPAPSKDGSPRSLAEAGFKPRRKDGKLVYRDEKRRFSAFVTPDGKMEFRDLPGKLSSLPGATEAARAGAGQELYIKEKKQLLADTFELRMQMAIAWARAQLDRQLRRLNDELARLWNNERMPIEERRRLLFERWDECDEAGSAVASEEFQGGQGIDAVRREAGVRARGAIETFIRTYLPPGSDAAYTEAELSRCNAKRQSRQKFDPYGKKESTNAG